MDFAVLFDFDGTLIDSSPVIHKCYKHLFDLYKSPYVYNHDIEVEVLGPSLKEEIEHLFPSEDTELLIDEYHKYQLAIPRSEFCLFDGAFEILKQLNDQNIPVGIVSSRNSNSLNELLHAKKVHNYTNVVIGRDMVVEGKPSPEGILLGLKQLGCSNGVYIGDNATDVIAGKRAGLYTVGFVSNLGKEDELKNSEPDVLIYKLEELQGIISRMELGEWKLNMNY